MISLSSGHRRLGFRELKGICEHAATMTVLPPPHTDPFICQRRRRALKVTPTLPPSKRGSKICEISYRSIALVHSHTA
jgi:hypothetical protein